MSTDAARDNGTVTKPGVYPWMPDATYHGDPVPGGSLSASGAKLLLPPSCPARFAWYRQHGRPPKAEFDLGHAAHRRALGRGADLVVIDADDYRTKAAREARDAAYAAGATPVLPREVAQVDAMFDELMDHPIAAEHLAAADRLIEHSLFWADQKTGIELRARLDLINGDYVVDYKTANAGDPEHASKALHNYGYAMQGDWYLTGAQACGLVGAEATFLLIMQETDPPYLVSVYQPDDTALAVGNQRNRDAIDTYRACVETDTWPGHTAPDEVRLLALPAWVERQYANDQEEVTI